jgi:hypothetical protein
MSAVTRPLAGHDGTITHTHTIHIAGSPVKGRGDWISPGVHVVETDFSPYVGDNVLPEFEAPFTPELDGSIQVKDGRG